MFHSLNMMFFRWLGIIKSLVFKGGEKTVSVSTDTQGCGIGHEKVVLSHS